jgi:hypothetical protein
MMYRSKITGLSQGPVTGHDAYGNPVYGPDTEETMYGEFFPAASTEPKEPSRHLVVTRFQVILPPTARLTAYDKLRILGDDYNLVGQPMPILMNGRIHHYETVVERVTG